MQNLSFSGQSLPRDGILYCFAIPADAGSVGLDQIARTFRIARSRFKKNPPDGFGSPAAVAGLVRFCGRVRSRPQKLYFVEARPERPALPMTAIQDILFFRISARELALGQWFGHVPDQLPEAELFDDLSDSVLQRKVQEVLELVGTTRLIQVAVYQKLSDIVNRSWE